MTEALLVVLSRPRPGRDDEFNDWYSNIHIRDAMRLRGSIATRRPGVKSAISLKYRPVGQMLPTDSEFDFIGVYHLSDAAARDHWPSPNALATSPLVEPVLLAVSCWDVLTPRLTKDAVLNPSSELLAAEERARARMGNRTIGARRELVVAR